MRCPICGQGRTLLCLGTFIFNPPVNVPGGPILVHGSEWEECDRCGEAYLPADLALDIADIIAERGGRVAYGAATIPGEALRC